MTKKQIYPYKAISSSITITQAELDEAAKRPEGWFADYIWQRYIDGLKNMVQETRKYFRECGFNV